MDIRNLIPLLKTADYSSLSDKEAADKFNTPVGTYLSQTPISYIGVQDKIFAGKTTAEEINDAVETFNNFRTTVENVAASNPSAATAHEGLKMERGYNIGHPAFQTQLALFAASTDPLHPLTTDQLTEIQASISLPNDPPSKALGFNKVKPGHVEEARRNILFTQG